MDVISVNDKTYKISFAFESVTDKNIVLLVVLDEFDNNKLFKIREFKNGTGILSEVTTEDLEHAKKIIENV